MRITGEWHWEMHLTKFCQILGKIKLYIEKVMGDYQNGFRYRSMICDRHIGSWAELPCNVLKDSLRGKCFAQH